MTSFIDLRGSKARPTPTKEKNEISFQKISTGRTPVQSKHSEITLLKPNKRLEGYDQYHVGQDQSRMNSEQTQSRLGSDNFKKSLRQIQNHTTDENIEEEYIKGLQDEIRLLEYELKLLKDKDIEQQASLSQIDHFFNDGVPLNENILAIKNQYVLVKKEFEARLLKYEEEERKLMKLNEDLKQDLNKLEEYYDLFSKEIREKEKKYKTNLDDIRKRFFEVKHVTTDLDIEYKFMQVKIRKLQDEIMIFSRAAEKEEVLSANKEETRNQSILKMRENILEKEKKISNLTKELEELKGNEIVNPAIMHLDKENSEMVKRLMYIEKEISSAKSRCIDMQYLLEMRGRERMTETQQKRDMNLQLQDLLLHYKEEHNVKEKVLQQKVEEKEKLDMAEMKKRTETLKTLIDLFKKRIARCERESENLIEAKIDVQQKTFDEEQNNQMLVKELEEMKNDYKEIKSCLELNFLQEKDNKSQLNPMALEVENILEKKPALEEEIKRLKEAIYHFMKQIELSDHVKQFNLEELKVITFNNNQKINTMEEDQEKFLEDAKKVVREQAYFMKKAIDSKNMRDALKFSSKMIGELSTSSLSPKTYYILYMQVFDELRTLENYFKEDYKMGRRLSDLYESVQHAQNVLPRLYLLVTVGAVYIQSHEIKARDILSDLLEMVKAVQHPLRGLFLRYYFLKMCKDKLPDKDNEYAEDGGDVNDSINCITSNLTEMNKLWIRMQSSKEKTKRERERVDLKVTVGENLHRLSSLEGVTLELYKNVVLPRLLDLITNSKDIISQEYLVDCIIQTFPDEFHLHTLQILLNAISTGLQPNADLKLIFIHLMDRLADFALNSDSSVESFNEDINIFMMFKDSINRIIDENSANMELKKFLDLEVAFLKFSLRCYPKNSEYVNQILKACVLICDRQISKEFPDDCQNNIVKFLTMPLETMSLTILQMNEYPNLMKYLPFSKRRLVASKICQAVVNLKNILNNLPLTEQLIKFINPLLVTEKDYTEVEPFEFEEEQISVAKLINLVMGEDIHSTLELLNLFKKKFLEGEAKRMKFTLPSLVFALFKVIRSLAVSEKIAGVKELIKEVKFLIDLLAKEHHELSLRLLLNLALCINEIDHEKELDEFTYEIISQAMLIYQDELGDSDSKLRALKLIISSIERLSCLNPENYDVLVTNATQYSAKLLKKNEQCLSVLQCTHLFFNQHYRNDKRVFECFKRCLKLADICLTSNSSHISLYISILNKFAYFLTNDCQTIKLSDVQECINLIKSKLPEVKEKETTIFWNSTNTYLHEKKNKGVKSFTELEL